MQQRGNDNARQIVGMDVAGKHVVLGIQGGRTFTQPGQRQAIGGINARNTQNADAYAGSSQATTMRFGRHATRGAGRCGTPGPGFIDPRARAIAVDPAGTDVHKSLW